MEANVVKPTACKITMNIIPEDSTLRHSICVEVNPAVPYGWVPDLRSSVATEPSLY
jgi:hypothetical protein